ncbi:MAG: hypothetical protein DME66_06725 [Verrucomicrobia bacterium]|nr:MAG: hypothetical protein DME66_06725 [Verrucomicrobiota bacterium]
MLLTWSEQPDAHRAKRIAVLVPVSIQILPGMRSVDRPLQASYDFAMALFRGLVWFVLFIVLAFCFVVLFEYGPHDFANGFQKEFARVKSFVVKETGQAQKPKK